MNDSGNAAGHLNEAPWGTPSNAFGDGTGNTPLQYEDTYTDPWTGFVYDMARWYDPGTGQFMSTDPLVDQTLQPFAYAGDDPANGSDPTGLSPSLVSLGGCYQSGQVSPWPVNGHGAAYTEAPFGGRSKPSLSVSSGPGDYVAGVVEMCYMDIVGIRASGLEIAYWYRVGQNGGITRSGSALSTPHYTNGGWLGHRVLDSDFLRTTFVPSASQKYPGRQIKVHAKAHFHDVDFPGCRIWPFSGRVNQSYDVTIWGGQESNRSMLFGEGTSTNTGAGCRDGLTGSAEGGLIVSHHPFKSI